MGETQEERIVRLMRAAGHEPTPEKMAKVRKHFGLPEPAVVEAAPADGGDSRGGSGFDVFQGAAARGFREMVDTSQFGSDQSARLVGNREVRYLEDRSVFGTLGVALGTAARKAGYIGEDESLFDAARRKVGGYFQGVEEAPENQPSAENAGTFWGEDFPRAAGSAVPFAVTQGGLALATGGASTPFQMAMLAGAQGAGTQSVKAYHEALGSGADEQTAWMSFLGNFVLGSTEGLGALPGVSLAKLGKLGGILAKFDGETAGALSKSLAGGAVKGFGQEFGQETGQGALAHLWDRHLGLHPEDARTIAEVFTDAAIREGAPAGVLGAMLGGVDVAAGRALEAEVQRRKGDRRERPDLQPVAGSQTAQEPAGSTQAAEATQGQPAPQEPQDAFYSGLKARAEDAIETEVQVPAGLEPLAEASKRRGHKLRFVKTGEASKFRGAFDRDTGDIIVNANRTDEAIESTVDHEFTHALEQRSGGTFEGYRNEIAAVDPKGLAGMEAAAREREPETSLEDLAGEGTAYYTEEVIGPWVRAVRRDPAKMAKIAQNNRPLFRRMGEALLDVVNAFTGTRFQTQKQQLREMLGESGFIGRRMAPEKAVRLASKFVEVNEALGPASAVWTERVAEAQRFNAEQEAAVAERRTNPKPASPPTIAGPLVPEPGVEVPKYESVPEASRYSRAPASQSAPASRHERFRRRIENSLITTERLFGEAKAGAEKAGKNVTAVPIALERLRKSKTGRDIETNLDPVVDGLAAPLRGSKIKVEEFNEFLAGRVMPIANKIVAERRDDPHGNAYYAGRDDAWARAVMEKYRRDPRYPAFVKTAKVFDRIGEAKLRVLQDAGRISAEQAQALRDAYDPAKNGQDNPEGFTSFYASLRDAPELDDLDSLTGGRSGSGLGPSGRPFKDRKGRAKGEPGEEVAFADPMAAALVDFENALMSARSQEVTKEVARFVEQVDDAGFGVVVKAPKEEVLDRVNNKVVERVDRFWMDKPNVLAFWRDGQQYAIVFHGKGGEHIAQSLRGLTSKAPITGLGAMTRLYGSLLTRRNPLFMLRNIPRDIGHGYMMLVSKRGLPFARATFGHYGSSIKQLAVRARTGVETDALREYMESGAPMATYGYQDYLRSKADMEARVEGGVDWRRSISGMFKWIEGANDVAENALRFAAFRAARESDMSVTDAALIAKQEVGLNFEKRGEWGPVMNSLYAFSQAGVNGTYAIADVLKNPKDAAPAVAVLAALGVAAEITNRMISPEGDDGEQAWDGVSEFEKSRNFVAMSPFGDDYAKVALPLGWNWIYNLGRHGAAVAMGSEEVGEASMSLASELAEVVNPLGAGPLVQQATPTVLDPFVQHATNRSFTGAQLAPENFRFGPQKPEHQLSWNDTGAVPRKVAEWLSRATRTDDSGRGAIEVRPDIIEHYLEASAGGLSRAAYQILGNVGDLIGGKELDASDVAAVNSFAGRASPFATDKRYRETLKTIEEVKDRYDELRRAREGARALDWRLKHIGLFKSIGAMQAAEKRLRAIPNTPENEVRRRDVKARFLRQAKAVGAE